MVRLGAEAETGDRVFGRRSDLQRTTETARGQIEPPGEGIFLPGEAEGRSQSRPRERARTHLDGFVRVMVGGAGAGGAEARHCGGGGVRRLRSGAEGREGKERRDGARPGFGGFGEGFGFNGELREIDASRGCASPRANDSGRVGWTLGWPIWRGSLVPGPSGGIWWSCGMGNARQRRQGRHRESYIFWKKTIYASSNIHDFCCKKNIHDFSAHVLHRLIKIDHALMRSQRSRTASHVFLKIAPGTKYLHTC
jgi:hypothetical protein